MQHAALFFLLLGILQAACQGQPPQTGHHVIAAAVRDLLDRSYAGIDYATYRARLRAVEAVSAEQLNATPARLHKQVEEMLGYLRVAEEILRWQAEAGNGYPAHTPIVSRWIARYPFLRAAVGAHRADVFDVPTALMLLWDKTDEVLRGLQLKSAPL